MYKFSEYLMFVFEISIEPADTHSNASLPVIHGLATDQDEAAILTADLPSALPRELATRYLLDLSEREEREGGEVLTDTLSLLVHRVHPTIENPAGTPAGDSPRMGIFEFIDGRGEPI